MIPLRSRVLGGAYQYKHQLQYHCSKYLAVKRRVKTTMPPIASQPIVLTETEKRLFTTLLNASQASNLKTTLRAAGGWVRDKLLGRDSPDIDVALDDMYGKDFAEHVNEYLQSQGDQVHTVAVIQSNPDQSKHLETARMKVHDMWIDLVNLRSESYAAGSRIPTIEFGSPEQDALRRDFTINSMFYNLNSGEIEDFTSRGLDDLRAGLIRTPLPAMETFLDDPLRVLRAIRFAARFGFQLDESLQQAASSTAVREALTGKVSRERIGAELEGMFSGQAPVEAVHYIQRFGLFPAVFALPAPVNTMMGTTYGTPCLAVMMEADAVLQQLEDQMTPEERRLCLLASLLLPLRDASIPVKKREVPVPGIVIRESLKWKAKDGENVQLIHAAAEDLHAVHNTLQGSALEPVTHMSAPEDVRVALGLALRKAGALWRVGIVLSSLLETPAAAPLGEGRPVAEQADVDEDARQRAVQRALNRYRLLTTAVTAFGLEGAHTWKPLLDGKQVTGAKGPAVGEITAKVIRWQLANPHGSVDECIAFLKSEGGGQ